MRRPGRTCVEITLHAIVLLIGLLLPASENLEEFNNVRPAAPEGRLEGGAQHDYWELASI